MTAAHQLFDASCIQQLFHGTIEPIEGPLRPGGYDGVFWTAESSAVAQCYIPATGGSTFASISRYELDQSVRPSPSSPFYTVAKMIGPAATSVEYDSCGRPKSWGIPEGYATYRKVVEHIEEAMGYVNRGICGDFTFEILTDGWSPDTGEHVLVPANYRKEGSLIIVDGFQQMRLLNVSTGESDLTDLQYNKLKLFRQAEAEGYDGVVIDDFCQSKRWGNVGHRSIGFFAAALARLSSTQIPAHRFDWDGSGAAGLQVLDSPEYLAWREEQLAEDRLVESSRQRFAA